MDILQNSKHHSSCEQPHIWVYISRKLA